MSQYFKYIIRGLLMMLVSILLVVIVFVLIQLALSSPSESDSVITIDKGVLEPVAEPAIEIDLPQEKPENSNENSPDTVSEAEEEGMYLRDLSLTESQRNAAESIGIDVDTYYLRPATMNCAESKLGPERYNEIVNGEIPGFVESTKLIQCL